MIVNVFLQNEKNSRIRNRYDEKTLQLIKHQELLAEAEYQYGFIPGTAGDDGDCLDIWFISDRSYETGKLLPGRIIGSFEMFEEYRGEREEDLKILVCPPDEEAELNEELIGEVKAFTLAIFRKFPGVRVTFGKTLTVEETEQRIENLS